MSIDRIFKFAFEDCEFVIRDIHGGIRWDEISPTVLETSTPPLYSLSLAHCLPCLSVFTHNDNASFNTVNGLYRKDVPICIGNFRRDICTRV